MVCAHVRQVIEHPYGLRPTPKDLPKKIGRNLRPIFRTLEMSEPVAQTNGCAFDFGFVGFHVGHVVHIDTD